MTAPRASQHLQPPPAPEHLRGRFPAHVVPAGFSLHRTHPIHLDPWWFGHSLRGRFDLSEPDGTCYTAETELVTLLEAWAGIALIPRPELAHRAISTLHLGHDATVADMTSNTALSFGITAEISTTIDYALTQHWATALRAAGYDGIRYWARHEVARTAACIALFNTAGAHPITDTYAVAGSDVLDTRPQLWDELRQHTGIDVIDLPTAM